jgi:hypothetical protein
MYSPHTFGFLHCTPLTAAEIKIQKIRGNISK